MLITLCAGVVSAQKTKVACVGDSITALPSSWCGDLSTKLGASYEVKNFGVSGTNLAKGVGQPYWSSAQYKPSHDFQPSLVIIMLGTNDGVPRVWSGGKDHFVADYEELIDTYESLASHPRVYLIIPIPAGTGPFGHDPDIIADEVGPMVTQVAMNKNVTTIDGFTAFGGKDFDPDLYGPMDQIHPNAKGQQLLCDTVYGVLVSSGGLGNAGAAGAGGAAGVAAVGGSGGTIAGAGAAAGGAPAGAGAGAVAGGAPAGAGAGAGVTASVAASAGSSGSATIGGAGSVSTGSAGTAVSPIPGNTTQPAAAGAHSAGSTATTAANGVAAAGTIAAPAPAAPAKSDDGGCSTAGSVANGNGPTAFLLIVIGLAFRFNERRRRRLQAHAAPQPGIRCGTRPSEPSRSRRARGR